MTPRPTGGAPSLGRLRLLVVLLAAISFAACHEGPRSTAVDLVTEAPIAEWWGPGQTRLIATPLTEIGDRRGKSAGSAALDIQLFLRWPGTDAREAALHLESGPSARAVSVALNRTRLGRVSLLDGRRTYRVRLPSGAQRGGLNRLRLTFEPAPGTEVPAGTPFHGARVAPEGDDWVERLVENDLAPVEISGSGDSGRLVCRAPLRLRYALELPAHPRLELAIGRVDGDDPDAGYRVTVQAEGGSDEEVLVAGPLPEGDAVKHHDLDLPGRAGGLVWLSLEATGSGVEWRAPRVTGAASLPPPPEKAASRTRPEGLGVTGVVLVILDAARARQLSTYGYERGTSLEIDRLAREGVVFEQAYAPAPYTISSMSALWTSLNHDQHHHGVGFRSPLPLEHRTLAEILEEDGIRTGGVLANPSAGAAFGLDRGFSEFEEVKGREGRAAPRAERLAATFWPQLDRLAEGPFFSYVHFLEPHFPFHQPEPFVTLFGPDEPLTPEERKATRWITAVNRRRRPFTPEESDHLVRLYDGNLAYVDREVGRLRRGLEDRGLLDRVVLIVTADHGDELFERGVIGHGGTVYEEVLRIPLVMRFPRDLGLTGLRIDTPVDLIDLAPTILDILGRVREEAFEGRSLLPVLTGGPGRPVLVGRSMHERPSYSYRRGPDKLIHSLRTGRTELYRLPKDRLESASRSRGEPLRTEWLRQELYRWLRDLERTRAGRTDETLPADTEEALKALGYLQ